MYIKSMYSEKTTKFCEIFPLPLTTVHTVESNGKITQNFVTMSLFGNFCANIQPLLSATPFILPALLKKIVLTTFTYNLTYPVFIFAW